MTFSLGIPNSSSHSLNAVISKVESVLSSRGYQIISVNKSLSDQITKHYFNKIFNRIKSKDLVIFFRQFSVLISASITLTQSLRILSEQMENPSLKSILIEVSLPFVINLSIIFHSARICSE